MRRLVATRLGEGWGLDLARSSRQSVGQDDPCSRPALTSTPLRP